MSGNSAVPAMSGNSEVPAMSGNSEVPAMSGTSAVPAMSENSEVSAISGTSAVPATSGNSEVPAMSANSEVLAMSGTSAVPAMSANSEVLAMSGTSAVPAMSENSEVPNISENYEVPAMTWQELHSLVMDWTSAAPTMSENSEVPARPENSAVPTMSENSEVPAMSENSEVPAMSENSEVPAKSGTSAVPAMSGTSAVATMSGTCHICSALASCSCPSCGQVEACGKEHLGLHYKENSCAPYSVASSPQFGRHIVATRNIVQGEVLFQEDPLVFGPQAEGTPLCLSCMSVTDCSFLCPSCGYPMCGLECAQDQVHREECAILAKGPRHVFVEQEVQEEAYHVILPLRLLLLGKKGPQLRIVEGMVEHTEERKKGEYWLEAEEHVVRLLREDCGQKQWSEEEIQGVVGRLELNCWEIHSYITTGFR